MSFICWFFPYLMGIYLFLAILAFCINLVSINKMFKMHKAGKKLWVRINERRKSWD